VKVLSKLKLIFLPWLRLRELELEIHRLHVSYLKRIGEANSDTNELRHLLISEKIKMDRLRSNLISATNMASANKRQAEEFRTCLRQLVARTRLELIKSNISLSALVEDEEDWEEITAAVRALNGHKNQPLN
jgi:hypothetical protein